MCSGIAVICLHLIEQSLFGQRQDASDFCQCRRDYAPVFAIVEHHTSDLQALWRWSVLCEALWSGVQYLESLDMRPKANAKLLDVAVDCVDVSLENR